MEVRLFGELEALDDGVPVPVRGAKQRALLALLALRRGQPVSAGRLIDLLWGDGQAANPANALQAQIGQLRRTFGAAAILTTDAGYALAAGPGEVDVVRFEQLVAEGRRLAAGGELRLRRPCWGGPAAAAGRAAGRVHLCGLFDAERAHLNELTLVAIEAGAEPTWAWGATGNWPANWRRCAGNTRSASAGRTSSGWRCSWPRAAGRSRHAGSCSSGRRRRTGSGTRRRPGP
jgi:DNA-binding SARP family transcriptional activator